MKIVAVIPAFDAGQTISYVVKETKKLVDQVIVINDGSRDNTKLEAEEAGADVVNNATNKGLGNALRRGFSEAIKNKADVIITLDSDRQHDPSEIKILLKEFFNKNCDIVIGSRLLDKKQWNNFPRHRLYGNLILTRITNLAMGRKFTSDSQSGYRVIKSEALKKMKLISERMEIASEIVYEFGVNNCQISEVPIKATYAQEISNQRILREPLRIIRLLFQKRFFR